MNKRVLIICPYFPPSNAADMHRVRMSLPYFKTLGWDAEVVTVENTFSELPKDDLLVQSIPTDIIIHKIKALDKSWTSKMGLGSIALRSIPYYRAKVNALLKSGNYHLIYFSTTQFPITVLGPRWKKKFKIPYVIDMQDPWHSEYYRDKPKAQRPKKYWLSYRLNKYMEPLAMKHVDGLISVSEHYINDLKIRYPEIANIPAAVITFGSFDTDFDIAAANSSAFQPMLTNTFKNIVYIGRGGNDMHKAIAVIFEALKEELKINEEFKRLRFYFIGTSYAPAGKAKKTIMPLAVEYGVEDYVIEIADRISFYHTLLTIQQADALFIPGSDDAKYTASKIYPYLSAKKPVLAIFNKASSAIKIMKDYGVKYVYDYENIPRAEIIDFFKHVLAGDFKEQVYDRQAIEEHSARQMAIKQCKLFELVINGKN